MTVRFKAWDCGFESRWEDGCLSFVSVVCCRVEVSATGHSLVQRSSTECGVSEYDREASIMTRPSTRGCCAMEKDRVLFINACLITLLII